MKNKSLVQLISIDCYSATPKYLQIANSIMEIIGRGELEKDEILPSINELSFESDISRDTAEKGYKYLKKIGILDSVPGKGYFVKSTATPSQLKIFLLVNKINAHKKIIYDSLVSSLGERVMIDFYVYNNDYNYFKKLVQTNSHDYSHYVIIPHFMEGGEKAHEIINATIPAEKLIIVDKPIAGVKGQYGAVYQNFKMDIYKALEEALPRLSQYHTIKIIFPKDSHHPKEIVEGLRLFCQQYSFEMQVIPTIFNEPIGEGEVYISITENDLIGLVEKLLATSLKVGKDVGIISYNETPLKKIILEGITTISADFELMGQKTAQLIQENLKEQIYVPFYLKLRASL